MNKFLIVNEHPAERLLRIVVGLALISLALAGPKTPWGWLGIVPILTGATGLCPLYAVLGISTCRKKASD